MNTLGSPNSGSTGGPLVPRPIVILVTLGILGAIIYVSSKGDYRTTIVLSLVLLFILGADVGAMIRGWRGSPPAPPQAPPAPPGPTLNKVDET